MVKGLPSNLFFDELLLSYLEPQEKGPLAQDFTLMLWKANNNY